MVDSLSDGRGVAPRALKFDARPRQTVLVHIFHVLGAVFDRGEFLVDFDQVRVEGW